MHRLTASTIAWLLLASSAHAQSRTARPTPSPVAASVPASGLQPAPPVAPPASVERMRHPDGRAGYWLDDDAYTEALEALSLEDGYLDRLRLASERLTLREREAGELRAAMAATGRARDELRLALRGSERARAAAVERMNAWWRAPATWLGVGAVLGAGLAVLMAFAIGSAE